MLKKFSGCFLCIVVVCLSSCSLLFKERRVNGNGFLINDFGLPVTVYKSLIPFSSKLVVMLSGDGGWLEFNNELAYRYSINGYHTIGFNSRSYFWEQRTPDQTTTDLVLLIRKYSSLWKTDKIFLCGYSFGADVIPFIYNRLPSDLKQKVVCLQLLSPFLSTDFVVHNSDLLNWGKDNRKYKVGPELEKVTIPVYCFYGQDEFPTPLVNNKAPNFFLELLPGDHHYKNAYHKIVSSVKGKEK